MQPAASPRHPLKAVAVVLLAVVLVHGAWAHVGHRDHGTHRLHIGDGGVDIGDCRDVDIDIALDDEEDDAPWLVDVFDDDDAH